jgi:hypothetical protein
VRVLLWRSQQFSLLIIYSSHRLTRKKDLKTDVDELLDALDPRRKTTLYRILNLIAPLMAAMLVVIAWPAAIYIKIREIQKIKKANIEEKLKMENKEFEVKHNDLVERLTVSEIELLETVNDPLNASPELPFGFLNQNWRAFVSLASGNQSFWSFRSEWTSEWGAKEILSGYVLVDSSIIGSFFVTSKECEDD